MLSNTFALNVADEDLIQVVRLLHLKVLHQHGHPTSIELWQTLYFLRATVVEAAKLCEVLVEVVHDVLKYLQRSTLLLPSKFLLLGADDLKDVLDDLVQVSSRVILQ